MIMKVKKDEDTDFMIKNCFGFKDRFAKAMKEQGHTLIDEDKFDIIEHKLLQNDAPCLKLDEAKMFAELVDTTNLSLLDTELPYSENEMRFFKASGVFMKQYRKWLNSSVKKKTVK